MLMWFIVLVLLLSLLFEVMFVVAIIGCEYICIAYMHFVDIFISSALLYVYFYLQRKTDISCKRMLMPCCLMYFMLGLIF